MSQGNGVISANDLMKNLARAKKVMDKVDGGAPSRSSVNENYSTYDEDDEDRWEAKLNSQQQMFEQTQPTQIQNMGSVTPDKIKNSKLPDNIKKAMMENPIPVPSISLSDNIDMNIIKGAKRLIEQDLPTKSKRPQEKQPIRNNTSPNIDMNALSIMIENTVRKVLDEKLNQILTAQETKSINENLVLKVGDSVFKGKITGVNSAK
jgi:hypothetical protein